MWSASSSCVCVCAEMHGDSLRNASIIRYDTNTNQRTQETQNENIL